MTTMTKPAFRIVPAEEFQENKILKEMVIDLKKELFQTKRERNKWKGFYENIAEIMKDTERRNIELTAEVDRLRRGA